MSSESIPSVVAILPLDEVMFPGGVLPLELSRASHMSLVEDAMREGLPIGVIAERNPAVQEAGPDELFTVGTITRIAGLSARGAALSLELHGTRRMRVVEFTQGSPYLKARIEVLDESVAIDSATQKLAADLRARAPDVLRREAHVPADLLRRLTELRHAGQLADMIAAHLGLTTEEHQLVLEAAEVRQRLKLVLALLKRRRQVLRGFAWPSSNVLSYALTSMVLGVYLYTGAIPWNAPYALPLLLVEAVAIIGLLRETRRWLR